jgi:glucosylceramidase
MIADLNAGCAGWVDWNMLLDSRGGPNHVGNYCFALLHASDDGQLVFTPSYAYMAHFSRYIKPKARRISAAASRSTLETTAFRNPDGSLAVVVHEQDRQAAALPAVRRRHGGAVDIPAHAIQTVLA